MGKAAIVSVASLQPCAVLRAFVPAGEILSERGESKDVSCCARRFCDNTTTYAIVHGR